MLCIKYFASFHSDLSTLFIKSSEGGYLYLNPEIVTPLYSGIYIVNLFMNLAWIFIWDNEVLVAASVFLFLIAITNMASLGLIANKVAAERSVLKTMQPKSSCAYIVLSLNGQAIYTTWTVIASLINMYIALHYVGDVPMITCSRISLSLLLVILIVWFTLENTILDSRFRLVLTPYLGAY